VWDLRTATLGHDVTNVTKVAEMASGEKAPLVPLSRVGILTPGKAACYTSRTVTKEVRDHLEVTMVNRCKYL
jgi:hypothetical protein